MKPIHKFNNGNGATLCHKCNCIISIGFADDLYCKECIKEPKQEILTYTEAAKKEERIFNSTMMSKQETLEEAGIIAAGMCEHLDAREQAFFIAGFIESVKWQQEKMYSEEDMRKAFKSSSLTNILDVYESFEEFIEQFKNK